MCGLAGFFDPARRDDAEALRARAFRMADALHLRGPDDRGAWADPEAGIALGFRRLSIVDLSPEGHQPMHSAGGRFVLAFNGEVYNHRELRRELGGGVTYRGHSDTEVMLAAFERWGVEAAVRRFVGMFAFALWDRRERTLTLARDRLGEKPLYYGRVGDSFLFGSELKALRAHPDFRGEVDRDALALYLRHGNFPAPHSVYRGVRKLPAGTLLTVSGDRPGADASPRPYWSAAEAAEAGLTDPFAGTESEAVDHLESLLRDSVRRQMVADVPLGAFLSGGVDSSTVVALMQAEGTRPTKTFTIGFEEDGFDEARYAREVATHLGTEHAELYVTPSDALGVIPGLPTLYDEPFADSSGIPFYLVSRMAKRDVTVCLSGDGGDELFGGYSWYPRTERLWKRVGWMPPALRRATAGALGGLGRRWPGGSRLPTRLGRKATGDRVVKLAEVLAGAGGPEGLHRELLSRWGDTPRVIKGVPGPPAASPGYDARPGRADPFSRLMLSDMLTYLPDDVLTKVDRASMGVSLEARAPFLDHRVVEFAWRVPVAMKVRDGRGKWLLRQVLYRHVPPALIDRPKMGFSVPIGAWLRGPLRDWAEGLLAEDLLRDGGLFEPGPIRRKWQEHLSGRRDWDEHLWYVLTFQAWSAGATAAAARGGHDNG